MAAVSGWADVSVAVLNLAALGGMMFFEIQAVMDGNDLDFLDPRSRIPSAAIAGCDILWKLEVAALFISARARGRRTEESTGRRDPD